MRRYHLFLAVVALILAAVVVYIFGGPQIDQSSVVTLDDLAPMALICLKFDVADHRGLPIWRSERAYIRFLQDKGVRVAVIEDENHQHQILIGFLDSLRIRKLHDEAKGSGLLVPELPFNSHIAE